MAWLAGGHESRAGSDASHKSYGGTAPLSANNLAMAGGRLGTSVRGGSVKSGRSGATRTRGDKSGHTTPLMGAAPAKALAETFASKHFFDPVEVVMGELHTRAGERVVRKGDLRRRNEEMLQGAEAEAKQAPVKGKPARG